MGEKKEKESLVGTEKQPKTHTVKKGDTVYSIAEKYLGKSSRAGEIRKANHLVTDILRVGKKLVIPKR